MIDFTDLIVWVITTAAVFIAAFLGAKVIPVLKEKGLYAFTAQMVKAAVTYFVDGQGSEKFDWVFEQIDAKYGDYFDAETIKNAIQGAYVDMCIALGKEPSPAKDYEYEETEKN